MSFITENQWMIALFSTLSGVVIGFLLTYLKDFINELLKKHRLSKALSIEVEIILKHLCADYEGSYKFKTEFEEAMKSKFAKNKPIFQVANMDVQIIYQNNLNSITLFKKEIIEKIVRFYSLVEMTRGFEKLLAEQNLNLYSVNPVLTADTLNDSLNKNLAQYSAAIVIGNELLKYFNNSKSTLFPKSPLLKYSL